MAELDFEYMSTLVERAKRRNSNAFAELFAVTYQREYNFAYSFLEHPYLAQDAMRQLYRQALLHLKQLKDSQSFISWLDRINLRVCLHMESDAVSSSGDLDSLEKKKQPPESHILEDILLRPLGEAQVILLYYYCDYSVEEIGEILELTAKEVQKYLWAGRTALLFSHNHTHHDNRGIFGNIFHRRFSKQEVTTNQDPAHKRMELPSMDNRSADILLKFVLEDCGYIPHTNSLDDVTESRIYRKDNYVLQRVLIGILLFTLIFFPVLFLLPQVDVSTSTDSTREVTTYHIAVSSPLRIKSVLAYTHKTPVTVYETTPKEYTVTPPSSDDIVLVIVTLENGQYVRCQIDSSGIVLT